MQPPEDDGSVESQTEAGPSAQPWSMSRSPSAPQFDTFWNSDFVIFQVENTLFCVLKHGFVVPGGPFEAMFAAPPEDPTNVEGTSADNPIVLHGTIAADFRAFLRVLYPFEHPVTSYDDWVGVLRLAHRWNFVKIREKAITSLTPFLASKTAEKIHLGNEFLVQDWLRQGLLALVEKQNLEPGELAAPPFLLDWKSIAKIFCIREKAQNSNENNIQEYHMQCIICKTNYGLNYRTTVCGCQNGGLTRQVKRVEDYFVAELAGALFIAEDDPHNAPLLLTNLVAPGTSSILFNLGDENRRGMKTKKKGKQAATG